MSDENKGGSDLDIFEGLGKKSAARPSAAPPPPPASMPAAVPARPPAEMKRTLLGIPGPAQAPNSTPSLSKTLPSSSGPPPLPPISAPAPGSRPPAPPSRTSLPALPQTPASTSDRPSAGKVPVPVAAPSSKVAGTNGASARKGGKLDMDWDDDNEATHIFDKEAKDVKDDSSLDLAAPQSTAKKDTDRADMDAVMSSPPRSSSLPAPIVDVPAPAPAPSTVSGAFASLGMANGASSSRAASAPPPPPPASIRMPGQSAAPPPPPPGQTTTAPMHMPPRPPSAPPAPATHPSPSMAPNLPPPPNVPSVQPASSPPSSSAAASTAQMPKMPPVSRAMEATAVVPRAGGKSKASSIGLFAGILAVAGITVYALMPRAGTLVVNVSDSKGGVVKAMEVSVDGEKRCDTAPCIVKDVSAGVHEVKVVAQGYDLPAPSAVTVEGQKSATVSFQLIPTKLGSGTGLKVASLQPGVKLSVDGKDVGPLPQELRDLSAGEHKLHFSGGDRYAPLDKTVSVAQDEVVDVGNVALKVLKGKATIQLGTPGAKVYLVSGANRKEVPQFPIAIDFDPNEHWQLEAKKDGFDDFVQPISFDDGLAEKTINVVLNPKGTAAKAASAAVAGAVTPAPAAPSPANGGRSSSSGSKSPSFLAGEGSSTTTSKPDTKKEAATGEAFLNINSIPASTVVLDGKPLGPTPKLKVSVSPGSHTVLFINAEQSLKKSITVSVGAGETKPAIAKLRD